MRNKIIPLAIFIVLAILVASLVYLFFYNRLLKSTVNNLENKNKAAASLKVQPLKDYASVDPNTYAKNQVGEIKNFTGNITEIADPAGAVNNMRILTVEADVIDQDKLQSVDFSKNSGDLPMVKKEFKVIANNGTQFGKGNLKDLKPGNLVEIELSGSIYDTGKQLTAVKMNVINPAR